MTGKNFFYRAYFFFTEKIVIIYAYSLVPKRHIFY